ARALAGRLPAEEIAVVTSISELDLPRLRASLPPGTQVETTTTQSLDWPPVTVIVNPDRECRLLRTGRPGDLRAAPPPRVPPPPPCVPPAQLRVFGRVDPGLVEAVRAAMPDALLAWCSGASARASIIDRCDIACVNTAEAKALVGSEAPTTRELALALAERGGV